MLTWTDERFRSLERIDSSPFEDESFLQEAQFTLLQMNSSLGQLAILFEMRQALNVLPGNTCVLIARGIYEFHWEAETRLNDRVAHSVVGMKMDHQEGLFRIQLQCFPNAFLFARSLSATFVLGDAQGLSAAPPDYVDSSPERIARDTAGWESRFDPHSFAQFGS
ncbi:MAG TPA: hypothetical protein VK139_07085 [Microbacteriaceae bacterium]|nr:hypothetical protein [Microbacteriaceae bacterium]